MHLVTVPAFDPNHEFDRLPLSHGHFSANGGTIEGPQQRDWTEIFLDAAGDLVVFLLDVPVGPRRTSETGAALAKALRAELFEQVPLHRAALGLELGLAAEPGLSAGLLILRISERDAKVELLNAGMPAVASEGPGHPLTIYPALSGRVGVRVGEVHPYELLPLVWGVTWLGLSEGVLPGGSDDNRVAELCQKLDLKNHGAKLSVASASELYEALRSVFGRGVLPARDASAVLVSLDPNQSRA